LTLRTDWHRCLVHFDGRLVSHFGRCWSIVIGNPPIAITMLRHEVTAGLFAP